MAASPVSVSQSRAGPSSGVNLTFGLYAQVALQFRTTRHVPLISASTWRSSADNPLSGSLASMHIMCRSFLPARCQTSPGRGG
jgi:hypothetical protein